MNDKPARARRASRPAEPVAAAGNGKPSARRDLVANEIYEQATRLFAERGFAGTSFQDIADAVGLTRPALYYYVRSKEELLAKLVTEITEGSAAGISAIARRADLDPPAKLHAIVTASVLRQAEYAARFRLLIRSEADLPDELAKAHEAGRRGVLKAVARVIDQGVEEGAFRPVDARIAALGLLGMNNWVAWWFQPDGKDSAEAVAGQLADMAVAALRSRDPDSAQAGPAGVLRQIRQDLDHLERLLPG
ncbi:MAG TPA: TetR/AcrR family transcriptional regulator [Streptosporangiaceae bacterium]